MLKPLELNTIIYLVLCYFVLTLKGFSLEIEFFVSVVGMLFHAHLCAYGLNSCSRVPSSDVTPVMSTLMTTIGYRVSNFWRQLFQQNVFDI